MTLRDIAEQANVSISTVSRCLSGSSLISAETRRRVLKIAEDTGFELNISARSQNTTQSGTIGIILPDDFDQFHTHLYHSSLHNHLRRTLEREDLDLIVAFPNNHFSGLNNVEKLVVRKKVDGLIMVLPVIHPDIAAFLEVRGIPYVYSHYPPCPGTENIDRVYVDHERGGMLVGEMFSRKERSNVAVFHYENRLKNLEFEQRTRGFKAGLMLGEYRGTITELKGAPTYESGFAIATDSADFLHDVDAVFALNDLMAFGIIQGLFSKKRKVPEDVMVVGYDDSPLAGTFRPMLTTVKQPAEEVAFLTSERLIKLMEDRLTGHKHSPKHIALQPQLVIRETA